MQATKEQQDFVEMVVKGTPCWLSARAGTGKTTTIKLAVEALKADLKGKNMWNPESVCAIAFNKGNQMDLSSALGTDVCVKTLHSLGFQALRQSFPRMEVETGKVFDLLKVRAARGGLRKREVFAETLRLISCAKNWGMARMGQTGVWKIKPLRMCGNDAWAELKSHFELWNAKEDIAEEVLEASTSMALEEGVIDFDDMTYLPVILGLPIISADRLIIDEAQDLSPLNIKMLEHCKSKMWFVGDPYQCIYGWRGAQTDVLEDLVAKYNFEVLPLTNCWRCSKEIIDEARKLVDDIRTDNGEEGPVQRIRWMPDWKGQSPAVVLSRGNSALVQIALDMRRAHVQGFIQGADFKKVLKEILGQVKGTNATMMTTSLQTWLVKKVKEFPHKSGELKDYCSCLAQFIEEGRGRQAAEKLIDETFADNPSKDAWLLSTIHRAKGREWDRVFILDWTSRATQPWAKKEERNLRYVAITRARKQLVWIDESAWEETSVKWEAPNMEIVPKSSIFNNYVFKELNNDLN